MYQDKAELSHIFSENLYFIIVIIFVSLIYYTFLYFLLRNERKKSFIFVLTFLTAPWTIILKLSQGDLSFFNSSISLTVITFTSAILILIHLFIKHILNFKNFTKYTILLLTSVLIFTVSIILLIALLFSFMCFTGGCGEGAIAFVLLGTIIISPIVMFIDALLFSKIYKIIARVN